KVVVGSDSYSLDVFDGVGTFTLLTGLSCARRRPAMVTLPSGDVMVAGGDCDGTLQPPEGNSQIFNGTKLSSNTSMPKGHAWFDPVTLPTGRVLAVGGRDGSTTVKGIQSAEYWSAGSWLGIGALDTGRFDATATVLANGKVLVAGGVTGDTSSATSS